MNEVSIKLAGGLGNYMFQIAASHSYGLNYNKSSVFTINDSFVAHNHISKYSDNIMSNVNLIKEKNFNGFNNFKENGFHYAEIPKIEGDVYLNGYFQSEKYFKDYEDDIKELFMSYEIELSGEIKNLLDNENTCSIHVRRGDYLNSPNHHPIQNMNYYMKAIKKMPKDSVFLIFSDDIEWCKNNFPDLPDKFIFIEGNKDYEDLYIMSRCKNNIIANSTFSWWGAWLNKNSEKIVIAPSKWFGSAYSGYDTRDIYCENWIKI